MAFLPNLSGVDPNSTLMKLIGYVIDAQNRFGPRAGAQGGTEGARGYPGGANPSATISPISGAGELEGELQRGEITPQQYQQIKAIRGSISELDKTEPQAAEEHLKRLSQIYMPATPGDKSFLQGNPTTPGTGSTNPGSQTSFGEPDIALRNMLETSRYGRVLTDQERSMLSQPQFAPGQVVPFPPQR